MLRREHPEPVPIREYQLFQLQILEEFRRICDLHGLRWCPAYGTLIGTVRHRGFIPWDDDIDIWMPAEDYLAFRRVCEAELGEEFFFQHHGKNPHNIIWWQRIGLKNSTSLPVKYKGIPAEWGICIDIIPLVPYFGDKRWERIYATRFRNLTRVAAKYEYRVDAQTCTSPIRRLYNIAMSSGSNEANLRIWNRIEREYLQPHYSGNAEFYAKGFQIYPKECFSEFFYLPFEGIDVPVPCGFAEILSVVYGPDWAQIPPENERIIHSGGGSDDVIVSLDIPYTEFLDCPCGLQ